MYRCHFLILLNAVDVSLIQGWTGVVDAYFWMTKTHSRGLVHNVGTQFVEDSCRHTSMTVIFSILLIVSPTQGLIGRIHMYTWMIEDPQPGSGKYGPHTFFSGHACTTVISLFC